MRTAHVAAGPQYEAVPNFDPNVPAPVVEQAPVVADPVFQAPVGGPVYGAPAMSPHPIRGVDSADGVPCNSAGGEPGWGAARPLDWQPYGPGEYVGHARTAHVPEYRLRVDDVLEFVFRLTREETSRPYQLNVGDEIRVESFTDASLNRDLLIQPDGTITLRLVGQVKATRQTVTQLRDRIEQLYTKYYKIPAVTVTPLRVNTKLEDLRATVDARAGVGGQTRQARVTPEGTIALPAIGNVPVQGLSLTELKRELDERYAAQVEGIEVTPVLLTRAPRHVYVLGEVKTPGRYLLDGPTTVMQSLALAGGWNVGANTRQVVVFRRGDDWRLLATMLDLRGALYGKTPAPSDELWVNDSDVIVVPKSPILVADDFINLVFTRGLYGVAPYNVGTTFSFFNQLPSN
ncbi:MAG: polysaccharide biosynthesis/export family protein [Planctomycetia bacterium]|nr:polysaccharide biosynthesis/export family protein [Planctomycetia bacterium]